MNQVLQLPLHHRRTDPRVRRENSAMSIEDRLTVATGKEITAVAESG
jgi:hypothetical protein